MTPTMTAADSETQQPFTPSSPKQGETVAHVTPTMTAADSETQQI